MHRFIFKAIVFCVSATAVSADACPVSRVDAYRGLDTVCGEDGKLAKPALLYEFRKETVKDCASSCLDNYQCSTFSFEKESNRRYDKGDCRLYSETQQQMQLTFNDRGNFFYDRQCFSRDCQTISACHLFKKCDDFFFGGKYRKQTGSRFFFDYEDYACGYGVTARRLNFPTYVLTYPGSSEVCEALTMCKSELYNGREAPPPPSRKLGRWRTGSGDLAYHIPTDQWICTLYNDEEAVDYTHRGLGPSVVLYYDDLGHVDRDRFTHQNSSIGASMGFYMAVYEFDSYSSSD